jgi:protein-S-isoprenylcysteine O-methyltransferase Ste14
MTRSPTLGPRGEGWVVIQGILLLLVVAAGWFGPAWAGGARVVTTVVGILLITAGATLAARGIRDLGDSLTPLPHPRHGASLVQTGVYARVRHPIYGGIVVAAFGWGLVTASVAALVMALVIWGFFVVKSMREEAWLVERFPDYPAYRASTRRLIPWIG